MKVGASTPGATRILARGPTEADLKSLRVDELPAAIERGDLVWIDVESPAKAELIELGESLRLDELTVEDCLAPVRMPRIDTIPRDCVFVAMFAARFETEPEARIRTAAVPMVIGPNFLMSVRRELLPEVVHRLNATFAGFEALPAESGMGLAYVAVDALVDRHLPAATEAAELAEQFEDDLNPENELRSIPALERLIVLRRDLLAFRRIGVFQSEVLRRLSRKDADLRSYYSDVEDNEREAVETAAATCDYIDGAIEAFQVRRDARTELGIRRLTVLAVILGPLSLTIGLWGVNFPNIPGTQSHWGWPIFVACHLAFMLLSIAYLRRARLL